jgi:hypothetical protein
MRLRLYLKNTYHKKGLVETLNSKLSITHTHKKKEREREKRKES